VLYEIRERVGAGDVSGAYRAPLAAARFSARDCSCMVTRPPSEPTVVSFPLGRIGDAHSRRAVPLDPKSDPGSSLLSHRPLADTGEEAHCLAAKKYLRALQLDSRPH
jgi:hypothetical protein